MSVRYLCDSARRRVMVAAHASLNGIDFLEVLDDRAPAGIAPQRTLLVHCHKPIPAFSLENVRLSGGVRITPVRCVWAARADLVSAPADAADVAFFPTLP